MIELTKEQIDVLEALATAKAENGTVDPATLTVQDLAGAYSIQAASFHRGGSSPRGFKLSLREGAAYSAPLLFVENGANYPFAPGIAVEPELALTLSRDLPPREAPYTRDDILDAVGKVSVGVEIVRSRFQPSAAWPLPLADFLSNIGYLVGAELDRSLLAHEADLGQVVVKADGAVLIDQPAKHQDADPLAVLVAYANAEPGLLGHFKAGQVITTGSLCGLVRIPSAGAVSVVVGGKEYALTLS